jgi:hypothetical protein
MFALPFTMEDTETEGKKDIQIIADQQNEPFNFFLPLRPSFSNFTLSKL